MKVTAITDLKPIYEYQLHFAAPCFFPADFASWQKSFLQDIDGEGRILFKTLHSKAVYDGEVPVGFIQYGRTAFGFDETGELSAKVSYPVIRSLYGKTPAVCCCSRHCRTLRMKQWSTRFFTTSA